MTNTCTCVHCREQLAISWDRLTNNTWALSIRESIFAPAEPVCATANGKAHWLVPYTGDRARNMPAAR